MAVSIVGRVFLILRFLATVSGDERYLVVFLLSNDMTQAMVASGEEGGWCHVDSPRLGWNHSLQVSPYSQLIVSDASAILGSGVENKAVVISTVGAVSLYMASEHSVYTPLPMSDLGRMYIICSCHIGTSVVLAIAASSDAKVDIAFKMKGTVTYNGREFSDGNTLSLTLQKHQTFTLGSESDITGTVVKATEPVAVFIGIVSSTIYRNRDVTTIATEQLVPVEHYGTEFVVPVYDFSETYLLRIIGRGETMVTFNNGTSLTTNGIYEQSVGPRDNLQFVTDKPVMATLCRNAERYSGFAAVSPVTSYGKNVAMYVGPYTLKIATKRTTSVTVWSNQGAKAAVTWEDVTNTNYKVGTVSSAVTFITASDDFTVLVFHSDHVHRGGYTGPYTSPIPDLTPSTTLAVLTTISADSTPSPSSTPSTPSTTSTPSTPSTSSTSSTSSTPDGTVIENDDGVAVGVSLAVIILILIIVIILLLLYIKRKTMTETKSTRPVNVPGVMYATNNPREMPSINSTGTPAPAPEEGNTDSRYAGLNARVNTDSVHDYTALHTGGNGRQTDGRISDSDYSGYEDLGTRDLENADYTALRSGDTAERSRNNPVGKKTSHQYVDLI